MGDRSIEDVLAEQGTTIEDVLGQQPEALSTEIQPGVPAVAPRLPGRLIAREPAPAPTEALSGPLMTRAQQRQLLLEGTLMGGLGQAGGIAGRMYLGRALTRPIGAAIGEAVGTNIGARVAGMPEEEAQTAALTAGGLGLAGEAGANLGARLIGSVSTVPESVINATLKMPLSKQIDVMIPPPRGSMPERGIGLDVLNRLKAARNELSPGRLTKKSIIRAADAANVTVPMQGVYTAIQDGIANASIATGRANNIAVARLDSLRKELITKFRGAMSPTQADAQLQAFQRDAEMAAARNNPFLAQTYRSLKDALRKSFFQAVDRTLPSSNIAKATAEAKAYMDSIDTLEAFVSDKTPETFVRTLFEGHEEAQSAVAALRAFEGQIGTGGNIEAEINRLGLKRAWNREDRGRAIGIWRAIADIVARPVTKILTIGARPIGQAAAAQPAILQIGKKEEKETPE